MRQNAGKKFIDHYQVISAEEGIVRQQNMEGEKTVHGSTEISKVLNETAIDDLPLLKAEPFMEQPKVETSLPKAEPASPKAEPKEPLSEQAGEQVHKSASPQGSRKSSRKSSSQHSPKQRSSPKSSPKQSAKCSRMNSKENGQQISPPKSPVSNTAKLDGEIKLDISNVFIDNSQHTEEAQTIGE